jgi:hypothetical protein
MGRPRQPARPRSDAMPLPRRLARQSCLAAALAVAVMVAAAGVAWARSEKTVAYTFDRVWPAAVRFLRVDERLKIVEKDADAGYVLFELREEGKVFPGALELIRGEEEGRPVVRLAVKIEDRPDYVESAMLGRLERKLREELGAPTPAPPRPAKPPKAEPPPVDAGP